MAGPTKLRRDAGVIGLLYASLGAMIGSGWLFGPLHASVQAGPWSVISWIIGAIAVLFLAFVFAELSTMFPNSGALVHMTHVSHGDLVGKVWTWILFLAFVSVPPVEVISVVTYANNYIPGLIVPTTGILTNLGTIVSIILLAFVVALNFLAIRIVVAINSAATWWKLIIPIATIGILMAYSFHPRPHYLLRVQGMSMRDAGILDGDLLAVHRSPDVYNGQIVVARVGDEVTVKRYRLKGSKVWLMPENREFQPLIVDADNPTLVLEGVVVGDGRYRDRGGNGPRYVPAPV